MALNASRRTFASNASFMANCASAICAERGPGATPLKQLPDDRRVFHRRFDLAVEVGAEAELADVEEETHYGREEVVRTVGGGARAVADGVGAADDLAHAQAAAGDQQRSEVAPVFAAAVGVQARRASHFAG